MVIITNIRTYPGQSTIFFLGIPCYRDKGFTPHNPGQDQFCARHILLGYITKEQGKQKHKLP